MLESGTQNGAARHGEIPPRILQRHSRGVTPSPVMYIRADYSSQRYGSVNTVSISVDATGVCEFKNRIFGFIADSFQPRKTQAAPLHELDPNVAIERACELLNANCPLATAVTSGDELSARMKDLTTLASNLPSPYTANIEGAVAKAVEERFAKLESALSVIERENPLALMKLSAAVKQTAQQIEYPEESAFGMTVLTRIAGGIEYVQSNAKSLPAHKRDVIYQGILNETEYASQECLKAIVTKGVVTRFKERIELLKKRCIQWGKQAQSCADHLERVQQSLQLQARDSHHLSAEATSGGRILLPGPSEEETRKTLCALYDCSAADLVKKLAIDYASHLHQLVIDELDDEASPLEAFSRVSTQQALDVMRQLVDVKLDDYSLYAALHRVGIDNVTDILVPVATPLVHLARSSVVNNIEPAQVNVLTLPPPQKPNDKAVLDRFSAAVAQQLEEHGQSTVEVVISDAVGSSCHLTRSIMGYPAPAQAEIEALAWAYVQSKQYSHVCHLFGILPDCPDGMASEIVEELVHLTMEDKS